LLPVFLAEPVQLEVPRASENGRLNNGKAEVVGWQHDVSDGMAGIALSGDGCRTHEWAADALEDQNHGDQGLFHAAPTRYVFVKAPFPHVTDANRFVE
jgi:hypothetical protein